MIRAAGTDLVTDADFETTVLGAGLPVLVEFTADWCGPCRQLAPVLSTIAKEEAERLTVVQIDVDNNPETTVRYGVLSTPTLMLFRQGRPIASLVGARSGRQLRRELAAALTD
ncbi:thioredoxin domain-containing protein [Streptomyces sp. NPDC005963]|uniref:thioredoxin family protein n=1 Tax=Streptomyces sp. NPDC005963 TaxID=3156721 RepID=UPI0033DAE34A